MGMDIYGNNETYFRANMWEWAALCFAMKLAGYNVPAKWITNDGAGLSSQSECDELAGTLENFLTSYQADTIVKESDVVHIDEEGRLVEPGANTKSPYEIRRKHLESFIQFLRTCNGFRIC